MVRGGKKRFLAAKKTMQPTEAHSWYEPWQLSIRARENK